MLPGDSVTTGAGVNPSTRAGVGGTEASIGAQVLAAVGDPVGAQVMACIGTGVNTQNGALVTGELASSVLGARIRRPGGRRLGDGVLGSIKA